MNTDYGEVLGRVREYLQDLVNNEALIRSYTHEYSKLNYQYGLCDNVDRVLWNCNTCRNIRELVRGRLCKLTSSWEYYSGHALFPVPSSLNYINEYTAGAWFIDSTPRDKWCEGAYADARWAYIKYLAENI